MQTFWTQEGSSSDTDFSTVQKPSDFLKFMVCTHQQGKFALFLNIVLQLSKYLLQNHWLNVDI